MNAKWWARCFETSLAGFPWRLMRLDEEGIGCIAFSPLAQGLLTTKYLNGVPDDSRASRNDSLSRDQITEQTLAHVRALNEIARQRGRR